MKYRGWERITTVFMAFVVGPLGIWYAIANMKSPLYEGINDKKNKYVQNAEFVKNLEREGLREGDIVLIELFSHTPLNPNLLETMEQYRARYAADTMGIVLGPTNCPKITEENVGPYLPFYGVSQAELPIWFAEIKNDPLCGQLIETDYSSTSAYFILVPPGGLYTRSFHYTLANTLERVHPQRWWEETWRKAEFFFWKNDIEPIEEDGIKIYVTSFSLGEMVAEQGIHQDIMLKFPAGLVFFAGLYLIISFHFLHQHYAPVLLSIFLTIEWTFGIIGVLTYSGFFHHTVYSVIPLGGGASVMGLSFAVQKMDAIKNENAQINGGRTTNISMIVIVTFTVLAFLLFLGNFAGLKRMQEIGMFFACAAVIAWFVARFVLPCIHEWWVEVLGERDECDLWPFQRKSAEWLDRSLMCMIQLIWKVNTAFNQPWKRRALQIVPPFFFIFAAVLFVMDRIPTISLIEAFLPDRNKTEESFLRAQKRGIGYSPFQIIMSISPPYTLTDERVMKATDELLKHIKNVEGMGMVLSPLQSILYQHQHAKRPLADAVRVVEEGEEMISSGSRDSMRSYLHTRHHAIVLAFHPMVDSKKIKKTLDTFEAYGAAIEKNYRDTGIKIRVWGPPAIFTEMAERTVKQTPQNVLTSLLFIFGSYSAAVAFFNWWYRKKVISPLWGGWTLSQSFMLATGITGCVMAICGIPLNIATAPISEVAIAAAADFNVYLAVAFLLFLYRGLSPRMAMKNAFEEKAGAVMKDYIGNSLCFVLLISSSLQPVVELGWLMIINLFVCVAWGLLMTLPMLAANAEKRMEVINDRMDRTTLTRLRRVASFL